MVLQRGYPLPKTPPLINLTLAPSTAPTSACSWRRFLKTILYHILRKTEIDILEIINIPALLLFEVLPYVCEVQCEF